MLGLQAYETSSDEEDNISHPATNAKVCSTRQEAQWHQNDLHGLSQQEEQTTSFRPRGK